MKLSTYTFVVSTLLLSLQAQAHDPSMHKEEAEKADCAAMKNMDHSETDANDPVMQAIMKKCMEQMHDDHGSAHGKGKNAGQDSQEKQK